MSAPPPAIPGSGRAPNRRLPWSMIALPCVLSLVLNLPALSDSFLPSRDTFLAFSGFGVFAKHLRQFGEIPLWLPTSAFGAPADWRQLQLLSPSSWVLALVAAVFDRVDLLQLFKVSILLEQSLYGLSCAWLAGLLFRRAAARVFFVIAAVMACGSWSQIYSNVRLVAPLPWMVGLLLLAFRRRSRALLLASLLPGPLAAYGQSFYAMALFGMLWSAAFVVQLLVHRRGGLAWLTARPTRPGLHREAAAAAALLLLAAIVAGQLLLVRTGQAVVSPMRDPRTGSVPLPFYLGYGYSTNLPILVYSSSLATPDAAHNEEAYLYVGMTAFTLALLGAALGRSRSARLAMWLLAFTVAYACSGLLTVALYWFPLMTYFRHVAYSAVVARFFLCILGAFGAQLLLEVASRNRAAPLRAVVRIPVLIALFLCLSLPMAAIWSTPAAKAGRLEIGSGVDLVVASLAAGLIFGLGIWAAARFLPRHRAAAGLAAVILVSVVASAWLLHGKIFERETWSVTPALAAYAREAMNAPLRYVPVRGDADPEMMRQFLGGLDSHGARYDTMDSMFSRDAPGTGERSDVVTEATSRLLTVKRDAPESFPFYAQQLQPKVFLAEDLRELGTGNALTPGEVVVETGKRAFALKRRDAAIAVRGFSFNHVSFGLPAGETVRAPATGRFLVYMDSLHPEWKASVDGRPAIIETANVAFKAVELPPGAREVSFRFGGALRRILALLNALAAPLSIALQLAGLFFLEGVFLRRE